MFRCIELVKICHFFTAKLKINFTYLLINHLLLTILFVQSLSLNNLVKTFHPIIPLTISATSTLLNFCLYFVFYNGFIHSLSHFQQPPPLQPSINPIFQPFSFTHLIHPPTFLLKKYTLNNFYHYCPSQRPLSNHQHTIITKPPPTSNHHPATTAQPPPNHHQHPTTTQPPSLNHHRSTTATEPPTTSNHHPTTTT